MSPDNRMKIDLGMIGCRGRFRAVVHTGHEYDADGNITKHGTILRETPFGRNMITLNGFNQMLSGVDWYMWCVAGSGNSAPSESDNTLSNFLGRASTNQLPIIEINNNPASLPLYWRIRVRYTFNPGSFGGAAVNIAEAAITVGPDTNVGTDVTGSTPVGARGLLVDSGNVPVAVAVLPTEYLDIVWEYTEYLPYDVATVVPLDINGTLTDHTFTVRPANLVPGGSYGWKTPGTFSGAAGQKIRFPLCGVVSGDAVFGRGTGMSNGVLGAPNSVPTSTYSGEKRCTSLTLAAYVVNSKQRIVNCTWALSNGNAPGPGYSNVFTHHLNHTNWQMSVSPAIQKDNTHQLDMTFALSMANVA